MNLPATLATLLLACLQEPERFPAADHCWLRFKAGTYIRSKITIDSAGVVTESDFQLALKEQNGDDYVVEETTTTDGYTFPPQLNKTGAALKTGSETLTVAGKEIPCTIWTAKGRRNDGPTVTRYWVPEGRKYPLKMVFKQQNVEGEVTATELDAEIEISGRTYSCAKLEGKIKYGPVEGTLRVWSNQELPSAQARMELVLPTPNGDAKIRVEPVEIHVER